MQLPCSIGADNLMQSPLDVHVDVFQLGAPGKGTGLYFSPDLLQTFRDLPGLFLGDDALFAQHPGMGNRAGDVLAIQTPVIVDGDGVAGRVGAHLLARFRL